MNQWFKTINDWFRSKLVVEQNALEQFEQLWSDQESGRSVTFMSIAINTSAISDGEIKDLGLSHWSKKSFQPIAHHWRIGEKVEIKDVVEFGNPDSFDFGTTQIITASDIRTILDDWALSLSSSCERLCIVMYGEQSIQALRGHWTSPVPVTVLDIEAVWRQRHHETDSFTFEEVALGSQSMQNVTSSLDHAGNQAYYLLALLTPLAGKSKNSPLEIEDTYE